MKCKGKLLKRIPKCVSLYYSMHALNCVYSLKRLSFGQSVQWGRSGTSVVSCLVARARIWRGRGAEDVGRRAGNMQSRSLTTFRPRFDMTRSAAVWGACGGMTCHTAHGELHWGVRVDCHAAVRAGRGRLGLPLSARAGEERRASGRFEQTFSSLCTLERCNKQTNKHTQTWDWEEKGKGGVERWSEEQVKWAV